MERTVAITKKTILFFKKTFNEGFLSTNRWWSNWELAEEMFAVLGSNLGADDQTPQTRITILHSYSSSDNFSRISKNSNVFLFFSKRILLPLAFLLTLNWLNCCCPKFSVVLEGFIQHFNGEKKSFFFVKLSPSYLLLWKILFISSAAKISIQYQRSFQNRP